jgi:hypothetical protein
MRSVAIDELNSAVSLLGRWDPVRLDLDESSLGLKTNNASRLTIVTLRAKVAGNRDLLWRSETGLSRWGSYHESFHERFKAVISLVVTIDFTSSIASGKWCRCPDDGFARDGGGGG